RLKPAGVGLRDVVRERAKSRGPRRSHRFRTGGERRPVNSGHKSGRNRFDVAFYSANLAGEENVLVRFHLQRWTQERWRIDVGVAMNLSIAQESGILQSRDQAQNSCLLAVLQMILKADNVVGVGRQIFLA